MAIAFKHITRRADGRTHIVGRRLTPYDILCQYELGDEPETLAKEYDLSMAQVYEALAYALDHPDEMRERRELDHAAARNLEHVPKQMRGTAREAIARDERAYEEATKKAFARRWSLSYHPIRPTLGGRTSWLHCSIES